MPPLGSVRARILRRSVLATLRAAATVEATGWLSIRAIWNYLKDEAEAEGLTLGELAGHLEYLGAKNYIAVRDAQKSKFGPRRPEARITPKGVDLMEESIPPDPGVEDDRA